MATSAQQTAFIDEYSSYADQASQATGINNLLILAQWANETNYGTQFSEKNNIGNIGVYGGGPNPSYATPEAGVQAYINFMMQPRYAPVRDAKTADAQAVALGESGYASGQYNDGGGPGSSLIAALNGGTVGTSNGAVGSTGNTGAGETTESESTAQEQLSQTEQQNQILSSQYSTSQATNSSNDTDAISYLNGVLQQYGLGDLSGWAWNELAQNKSADQVVLDLQSTPQFNAAFPGMKLRQQNNLPAMSVSDYLSYEDQAQQMARAAGMPAGFMTTAEVGTLIGNDVSSTELSDRITNGYQAAMMAPPETRTLLSEYYGVAPGGLAAYYLDPNNALPLLEQQTTAAQIGSAGVTSGVGDIGSSLATLLAGTGVTAAQASSGFQNIAPLTPLETALPGTPATGSTVSTDQLASSQFIGDAASTRAVQQAQETRKAPSEGGGGFALTSKGVAGAGSAGQSGNSGS